MTKEDLDKSLSGKNLPETSTFMTSAESKLLEKLVRDFSLEEEDRQKIVVALYGFKQAYRHYLDLWRTTANELGPDKRRDIDDIFIQVEHNLDRDARSSFSNGNFFAKLRFLLHACETLGIKREEMVTYMEWVLHFPITPRNSIKEIMEEEIFPSNLPHTYMHMTAGFVREQLVDLRRNHKEIKKAYRKFLSELNVKSSHNKWFKSRLPGSYGSRQ